MSNLTTLCTLYFIRSLHSCSVLCDDYRMLPSTFHLYISLCLIAPNVSCSRTDHIAYAYAVKPNESVCTYACNIESAQESKSTGPTGSNLQWKGDRRNWLNSSSHHLGTRNLDPGTVSCSRTLAIHQGVLTPATSGIALPFFNSFWSSHNKQHHSWIEPRLLSMAIRSLKG